MNEAAALTTAEASPPLRILLVEDDEFDVAVFGRAFRRSSIPCEIVRCKRGEEVLSGLRDAELSFDLLVADHQLPGMSGYDLCVRLLADSPPFALVLLTGGGSEQMAIRALRAGINEYLVKDSSQEYLNLLPLILPKVARRHRERRARGWNGKPPSACGNAAGAPVARAESIGTTGLGLADCATLVRRRGGRIWIEQREDEVPMLHLAVPLAKSEAEIWNTEGSASLLDPEPVLTTPEPAEATVDPVPAPPHPPGPHSRHALIVHPNPIVTFVTTRILDRLGYRSAAVANGRKAIEALDREPFDLALMGLSMPVQDGFETARQIREREASSGAHMPIVALAADPEEDLDRCREVGIDTHVERPVAFEALSKILARVMPSK